MITNFFEEVKKAVKLTYFLSVNYNSSLTPLFYLRTRKETFKVSFINTFLKFSLIYPEYNENIKH